MKRLIIISVLALTCGCAGVFKGPAATLPESSPLDNEKNCFEIQSEAFKIKTELDRKIATVNSKRTGNIVIGTIGLFLFWPALFAMDLSDNENQEVRDWQKRFLYLSDMWTVKKCPGVLIDESTIEAKVPVDDTRQASGPTTTW